MSRLLQLSLTDFRQILREQLLWVMFLLAPSLQFVIARWLVPELIDLFPVLSGQESLIAGLFTLQVVNGIGFVIAMMLLDEKDEGVLSAIQVLPLSARAFLTYRLFTATLLAWIFGFAMLYFSGLTTLSIGQALAGSALFALMAPLVTLFMSAFGDNKVEGLAMYKGINLVLLLPMISFFVPAPWSYFFALIPDFWSFQLVVAMTMGNSDQWLIFTAGLVGHLLLFWLLFRLFRQRIVR